MANEQNLKPISERSAREQKEMRSKGGINSGIARKRKADLRRMAQEILDGTYTDKTGRKFTGEEAVIQGIVANLTDPKGKNWGKAMDLLITLLGANKGKEEKQLLKAQIALAKAKAELLNNPDELNKLDETTRNEVESLVDALNNFKSDKGNGD